MSNLRFASPEHRDFFLDMMSKARRNDCYQKKWCREKHPCQKWCDRLNSEIGLFLPLTKMVQLDL